MRGIKAVLGDMMKAFNADNPAQGAFNINTGVGVFKSESFLATTGADGILDITFDDDGGEPSWKFNGIEVQGAPTVTLTGNLDVAGALTINEGGQLTLGGTLDVDGDVTLASGASLDVSASNHAVLVGGSWTDNGADFNAQAGTVTFDGNAAGKTITASAEFHNLDVNGAGGEWTLQGDITARNNLSVTAGTLLQPNSGPDNYRPHHDRRRRFSRQ